MGLYRTQNGVLQGTTGIRSRRNEQIKAYRLRLRLGVCTHTRTVPNVSTSNLNKNGERAHFVQYFYSKISQRSCKMWILEIQCGLGKGKGKGKG
jgi:hypothetical protein